ncbi:MAG: hypothetical protein N3A58_05420 [Spirochaetes bacterium]|nr:hypothetical protein [Spirochaetota bacterium]
MRLNILKIFNFRNFIRFIFIILYILVCVALYNIGKGHTINIVNQKFIAKDGTEIPAKYTCKIISAVEPSPLLMVMDKIWFKIFKKKIYKENVLTYFVGVPGQIVVPWHKKNVIFEFYDGKNLVKRIEKNIEFEKDIPQYLWNLAALYEDHPEWSSIYIIEAPVEEVETTPQSE